MMRGLASLVAYLFISAFAASAPLIAKGASGSESGLLNGPAWRLFPHGVMIAQMQDDSEQYTQTFPDDGSTSDGYGQALGEEPASEPKAEEVQANPQADVPSQPVVTPSPKKDGSERLRERLQEMRERIRRGQPQQQLSPATPAPLAVEPTPTPTTQPRLAPGTEDEEIISLGTEMSVGDLVQLISELTGDTYVLDEAIRAKRVSVIAPSGGFKRKNALRLFEAILDLNGFSIVKTDGVNKIVLKKDVKTTGIPTELGISSTEPSDRFITRVVQLKNLSASEVASTLRPFISQEGDIVAYPASNTVIIVETSSNLNRILKIIENIDRETVIEFIKIQHVDAAQVADKLVEIFGGGTAVTPEVTQPTQTTPTRAPLQATRAQRTQRTPQPAVAGVTGTAGGEQIYLGFKVIVDDRTNTLIVTAHPDDLIKIKSIIKKLDVEVDQPEQGIYVIRLQNANAEEIVSVLSSLISGTATPTAGATTRAQTRQRLGRTTGTFGGASQLGTGISTPGSRALSGLSGTEQGAFGIGAAGSFIERQVSTGGGLQALIAETEGIRITADPSTNSVILIGSRKDYEIVKSVIAQLDIRRKQVFVEAAILEVSLDKLRNLGANLSLGFTFNNDNLGFGGTILPGVPSLLGIAANTQAAQATLSGLQGLFLGVVGEQVDPDGPGPIPPIPSFSALFQAFASLTDVNVLSTPSIITTDNEQAEIVVADVIPFPTGTTVGETGVTVQTIDRQPVGIRLAITPQISEGDFLNLNILTEVSAIRETPVSGLNTQDFGIATTTRTADSSVVVKNGQTIVIGGLVQDRESTLENKVPILGDVPILGRLFKFHQKSSSKINLMILLTPRIVENEADMQQILEEKQQRNMLLQQRGF
jgi:general secretion pathway protein D